MVNCPKCGFSQPEDRYCANCGIDMDSYVPPKPSLPVRLFRNPLVHVVLLALTIGLVFKSIQNNQEEELSERIKFLESGEDRVVVKKKSPPKQRDLTASRQQRPRRLAKSKESAALTSRRDKFEQSQKVAPSETGTIEKTQPMNLKVKVLEIESQALAQIMESAQSEGSFYSSGDFGIGIIKSNPTGSTLKSWSARPTESQKEFEFFAGNAETDSTPELGLRAFLLASAGESGTQIELELIRSLPIIENDSVFSDRQALKEAVQLNEGETLVVIGLLPGGLTVDESTQDVYPSIFKTLFKEGFAERELDLILTISQ